MIDPAPGILLVEKLSEEDEKTASGLILSVKKRPVIHVRVLTVGDPVYWAYNKEYESPVVATEEALVLESNLLEVISEGKTVYLCKFQDILGVVSP